MIQPGDIAAGDAFGSSIEAAGSLLLVHAPGDASPGSAGDALHVYERDPKTSTWQKISEILPEQPGESIGVFATDGSAFAYVLDTSELFPGPKILVWQRGIQGTWEPTATFQLGGGLEILDLALEADDLVALSGGFGDFRNLLQSFRVDGVWQPLDTGALMGSTHESLDLAGDTLVSGSNVARRSGPGNLFPEPMSIRPPGEASLDAEGRFGSAVALSDDGRWLVVGSALDDIDGTDSGSAYLYEVYDSGFVELVGRFAPSEPAALRRFGASVAFESASASTSEGARWVISAPGDPKTIEGRTYAFDHVAQGIPIETHRLDQGEARLALAGDDALVGRPLSGVGGSVAVYDLRQSSEPPRVNLDLVADCTASSFLTVIGNVTASEAIALVTGSVDGGTEEILCVDCGTRPDIRYGVNLLTCRDNAIVVTAEDAVGQIGSAGVSVYFDDADPVITPCEDQTIVISPEESVGEAETPSASDGCELVSFECTNQSAAGWPRFPVGPDQPASCVAVDRCGRQARCDFSVTVQADFGEPRYFDFSQYPDGMLPQAFVASTTGGLGTAEVIEGKVEMTLDAAPTVAFASLLLEALVGGPTRAETGVPSPKQGSASGQAGVSVRTSDQEGAPMVRASRSTDDQIVFEVRLTQGAEIEAIADPIPVHGVTDLAVELDFETFRVEYSRNGGDTWIRPEGALGGEATIQVPPPADRDYRVGLLVAALGGLTASNDFANSEVGGNVSNLADHEPDRGTEKSSSRVAFTFDYLEVGPSSSEPPPVCEQDDFDDGVLDPAWTLAGIGNANQQSVLESEGKLRLTADGATAFYGADNAGFLYRELRGDFRVEATIDGGPMTTGGRYRKAGLMVRHSLDRWDTRLLAQLVPYWGGGDETHLQFVARETYGTPGYLPVARDVVGVARVVRLAVVREGQTLSVEYSIDGGASWVRPTTGLGGSITIEDLAPSLYVGLDMVSNDISVTSTAHFEDVAICQP